MTAPASRSVAEGKALWTLLLFAAAACFAVLWVKSSMRQRELQLEADQCRDQAVQARDLAAQAQEASEAAESRYRELLSLSSLEQVRDLEVEAQALWPAHPHHMAALQEWLQAAERLDALQVFLQNASDLARNLGEHQEAGEAFGNGASGELAERWWHGSSLKLAEKLISYTNRAPSTAVIDSVRQRLHNAKTLWQRSIGDHEQAWQEARESIAQSPLYAGFDLTPQLGLVPIGVNEITGLHEFWHLESGARPTPASSGSAVADGSGLVLVLIPGGTFWMGAQASKPDDKGFDVAARQDEVPHLLTLAPFFLSKFEGTQEQWQRLFGNQPSHFTVDHRQLSIRPDHPVENVSWEESVTALRRVGLTLPTEAQWECAARGGTRAPCSLGCRCVDLV